MTATVKRRRGFPLEAFSLKSCKRNLPHPPCLLQLRLEQRQRLPAHQMIEKQAPLAVCKKGDMQWRTDSQWPKMDSRHLQTDTQWLEVKWRRLLEKPLPNQMRNRFREEQVRYAFYQPPLQLSIPACHSFLYLRLHAYSMPIALFSPRQSQTSHYRDA